ncbi:unnamed protein product, partial [Prorocentrum cordatum]
MLQGNATPSGDLQNRGSIAFLCRPPLFRFVQELHGAELTIAATVGSQSEVMDARQDRPAIVGKRVRLRSSMTLTASYARLRSEPGIAIIWLWLLLALLLARCRGRRRPARRGGRGAGRPRARGAGQAGRPRVGGRHAAEGAPVPQPERRRPVPQPGEPRQGERGRRQHAAVRLPDDPGQDLAARPLPELAGGRAVPALGLGAELAHPRARPGPHGLRGRAGEAAASRTWSKVKE